MLRDWITPKKELVEELEAMVEAEPSLGGLIDPNYWKTEPKREVISYLDHLPDCVGKNWCTECGWNDEPCPH